MSPLRRPNTARWDQSGLEKKHTTAPQKLRCPLSSELPKEHWNLVTFNSTTMYTQTSCPQTEERVYSPLTDMPNIQLIQLRNRRGRYLFTYWVLQSQAGSWRQEPLSDVSTLRRPPSRTQRRAFQRERRGVDGGRRWHNGTACAVHLPVASILSSWTHRTTCSTYITYI